MMPLLCSLSPMSWSNMVNQNAMHACSICFAMPSCCMSVGVSSDTWFRHNRFKNNNASVCASVNTYRGRNSLCWVRHKKHNIMIHCSPYLRTVFTLWLLSNFFSGPVPPLCFWLIKNNAALPTICCLQHCNDRLINRFVPAHARSNPKSLSGKCSSSYRGLGCLDWCLDRASIGVLSLIICPRSWPCKIVAQFNALINVLVTNRLSSSRMVSRCAALSSASAANFACIVA